jgi:regulator of sirC expression with transglutaminase-like and TPR domain
MKFRSFGDQPAKRPRWRASHDMREMVVDPRSALLACVARDEADVAQGALWLAAEDCDDVDVDASLAQLDELADELKSRGPAGELEAIPVIAELFRERLRLRGAGGGDPRAHYLHRVLERGSGVPLAAAVLWIAIGKRAGLEVEGVGIPGHFVVRMATCLVNPFGGDIIDEETLERSLGNGGNTLDKRWFMAATSREICARMSRNLRGCYINRQEWDLALRAADRCVALQPEAAADVRDRGLLRWRLGMNTAAAEDLRRYVSLAPQAGDAAGVSQVLAKMRASSN